MAIDVSSLFADYTNPHKLLRREFVDKIVLGLKALLLLLMVYLIAQIPLQLFDSRLSSASLNEINAGLGQITESPVVQTKNRRAPGDLDLIISKNIFGPFAPKTNTLSKETVKPVAQIPLDLIGTFVTKGAVPYAIIEDRNKKQQDVFNIGETVFGGGTLLRIFTDRVDVDRSGQVETLTMDLISKGGAGSGGGSGVSSSDGEVFAVDEAELDKALANLPLLLTQARAVPYFKDGQSVGLRLFAIKAGSLFEKIGLKNGDILKTLNGTNLGDLSQAMKLFERLKDERSLALSLERNREEKSFQYQVK